jgi:hypothetical protein
MSLNECDNESIDAMDAKGVDPAESHVDWYQCVLCQNKTQEILQCPANSKRRDVGAGYNTLADHFLTLQEMGQVPDGHTDMSIWGDKDSIASTLLVHTAKWHNSCNKRYARDRIQRAQKRKSTEQEQSTCKKYTRSCEGKRVNLGEQKCFFCGKDGNDVCLHEALSFEVDARVRKAASFLQDEKLLAYLTGGDLVAQEAKYHQHCLIQLYNRERAAVRAQQPNEHDGSIHGIAFAELISYIEDVRNANDQCPIFKLADLVKLYTICINQFEREDLSRVNSTRLKQRILEHFPDMKAHTKGRDVLMVFNDDLGEVLQKAREHSYDEEGIFLLRAAQIIRRDMLHKSAKFNGTFTKDCQENSVPQTLLSLIRMLLYGPSIKCQSDCNDTQTVLSISQLIQHNCLKRRQDNTSNTLHHDREHETPLAIYLGVMIHANTRKRDLVDKFFRLGLSISYKRVLTISTDVANSVCESFKENNAVVPPQLRKGLFTTAATDNIDHNPSATTAHDSFHGTGISLFQQPSADNAGEQQQVIMKQDTSSSMKVSLLPEPYTCIPPSIMRNKRPPVPQIAGPLKGATVLMPGAVQQEKRLIVIEY